MKRRVLLLVSLVLLAVGAGAGSYWLVSDAELRMAILPALHLGPAALVPSTRPELSASAATELLARRLESRPVVVRLALGDVIVVDLNGRTLPLYPKLAEAGYVTLRLCHFPGAGAVANQICLAELAEKAKPYLYAGKAPLKVMPAAEDSDFRPPNRTFVSLVLARPRLGPVRQLLDTGTGSKSADYEVSFELTPLAPLFEVSADPLPSMTARAEFRRSDHGWQINSDGLP